MQRRIDLIEIDSYDHDASIEACMQMIIYNLYKLYANVVNNIVPNQN